MSWALTMDLFRSPVFALILNIFLYLISFTSDITELLDCTYICYIILTLTFYKPLYIFSCLVAKYLPVSLFTSYDRVHDKPMCFKHI